MLGKQGIEYFGELLECVSSTDDILANNLNRLTVKVQNNFRPSK